MTLLKAKQQTEGLFQCMLLLLTTSRQTCHGFYNKTTSLASR